ncbi:MAG: putative sensor protein [Holophagaceae bacterium]|nr:putative sensor protein [Holophagaceae bacterium]
MGCTLSQPAAACMGLDGDRPARRGTTARLGDILTRDGLIVVCSWCRKARTESGHWADVAPSLLDHPGASLTHGACPDCARRLLEGRHDAA